MVEQIASYNQISQIVSVGGTNAGEIMGYNKSTPG